ncbi:MAG TPA: DUF4262 domain-containing protein [Stellaceae bacterium]|jgi:hypothetical protein|nr:DUF4262 domain-containing protein [Stellaceae bacterium]
MPDEAIEKLWAQLRRDITEKITASGQCVQVVYRTEHEPPDKQPFMYTIGNYHHGLPELLMVDTDKTPFANILNRLGEMQRARGRAFADEELVSIGGKFPVRIVDAGVIGRTKYATFVGIFYGTQNYDVRQVLVPDLQGRWPDTPGCDLPYRRQPILSQIGRTKH